MAHVVRFPPENDGTESQMNADTRIHRPCRNAVQETRKRKHLCGSAANQKSSLAEARRSHHMRRFAHYVVDH